MRSEPPLSHCHDQLAHVLAAIEHPDRVHRRLGPVEDMLAHRQPALAQPARQRVARLLQAVL
jgi:hypothetical protein